MINNFVWKLVSKVFKKLNVFLASEGSAESREFKLLSVNIRKRDFNIA